MPGIDKVYGSSVESGWSMQGFVQSARDFIRQILAKLWEDECFEMASSIAFHLVLSIFPTLIFFISLFGIFGSSPEMMQNILAGIGRIAPPESVSILQQMARSIIESSTRGLALGSFIGAIWATSGAAHVVLIALRKINGDQYRSSFVKDRVIGLVLIFSMAAIGITLSNVVILGSIILQQMPEHIIAPVRYVKSISYVSSVVIFGLLVLMSGVLYAVCPGKPTKLCHWRAVLPGSVTFSALWFLISMGFSYYVANFGNFDKVYGTLGAFIVLMIWVYLSVLALLIGGVVNAIIMQRRPQLKNEKALIRPS